MQLAHSAYSRPDAPARNSRTVEYDLFAQVTRNLNAAWLTRKQNHAGLVTALYENNRLWRILAVDVAEPGNALPEALRAQLFYLYEFTRAHSEKVLAGEAEAGALIDINTAVMRGLRGQGGAA
jgi:flagellar protein FlaF